MAIEVLKFEIKDLIRSRLNDSVDRQRRCCNHELLHLAQNFASYETVEDRTVSQDGTC